MGSESTAARGQTNCVQSFIRRCWWRSVDSEVPEFDTVVDSGAPETVANSSLCRLYEELTVKQLANSECTGRNFANGCIDTQTCRRCDGNDVKTNRFTEWCQMNGDAGGCKISVCR